MNIGNCRFNSLSSSDLPSLFRPVDDEGAGYSQRIRIVTVQVTSLNFTETLNLPTRNANTGEQKIILMS
jgi:hypothetical protein